MFSFPKADFARRYATERRPHHGGNEWRWLNSSTWVDVSVMDFGGIKEAMRRCCHLTFRRLVGLTRDLVQTPYINNVLGAAIVLGTFGWLYTQEQIMTAGSSLNAPGMIHEFAKRGEAIKDGNGLDESENEPPVEGQQTELPSLSGRDALLKADRLLRDAEIQLQQLPAYSATFLKQERLGNSLSELQSIQLRVTHQPLRIFMKWEAGNDTGQRVLFVEGENDGAMLVRKVTGIESRLGVMQLHTHGILAMRDARHPVTRVGLLPLVKLAREYRGKELASNGITATLRRELHFNGRKCWNLTVEYQSPKVAPDEQHEYRKTVLFIDVQNNFPLAVWCYGWPERIRGASRDRLDETTLLEFYAYQSIDLQPEIQTADFTRVAVE